MLRNGKMFRVASGYRAASKHGPNVQNGKRLTGEQTHYWGHIWSVVRKKISVHCGYRLVLGLASNHFSNAAWDLSPVDRGSDRKSYFEVEKWSYIL